MLQAKVKKERKVKIYGLEVLTFRAGEIMTRVRYIV
jgi:hypothetical protein